MSEIQTFSCPCCSAALVPGLAPWHWRCPQCHYEGSTLKTEINDDRAQQKIDEEVRDQALHELRSDNFFQLLDWIVKDLPSSTTSPKPVRLLDVGAGQGWFMNVVHRYKDYKFDATGIEPDAVARACALAKGVSLKAGFFPDCLSANEKFLVVAFNDSLEHMLHVGAVLGAAADHLEGGGLVAVTLPNARGVFYKVASMMMRMGLPGPFERMWQKGLPSPHLHYFNPGNLGSLASLQGLEVIRWERIESLRIRGLYARISYARAGKTLSNVLIWLALLPLVPFLGLLTSDIMVVLLRKKK